jgi:hypothetical protein
MGSAQPAGGEVIGVHVPGGRLAVEMFRSGSEPVLAIHGISSQRKLWNWLQAFCDALDVLLTVRPVPGVDHAASIMTMTGARATADLIAEALS